MIPSYLLTYLSQAEDGNIEAQESLDELLSTEDLENMTIDEVYRISKVLSDVKLTDFFEPGELLKAKYITRKEYDDYVFERCENAEVI